MGRGGGGRGLLFPGERGEDRLQRLAAGARQGEEGFFCEVDVTLAQRDRLGGRDRYFTDAVAAQGVVGVRGGVAPEDDFGAVEEDRLGDLLQGRDQVVGGGRG